jgi:hypothetical protein
MDSKFIRFASLSGPMPRRVGCGSYLSNVNLPSLAPPLFESPAPLVVGRFH